jgi:phospholipase DDHD1
MQSKGCYLLLYKLSVYFSGKHQRLDYVLRDTNLGGSYLSALTSHTAYWSNYDVAYFVLTRLFHDLGSPASVSQQSQAESNYKL